MNQDMSDIFNAVFKGDLAKAKAGVQAALDAGASPQDIIYNEMIPAMEAIGADFGAGKVFVPNLLLAARAMKGALELLKPLMTSGQASALGTVVIGTVKGDLHDIGKNLVASMLEGCGFEVFNLGIDVPKEKFVAAVTEHNADILCLSALLTTTMGYMKDVIDAVRAGGLSVKIMVGGAPVSAEYAAQVGADGFSANANEAVLLAKSLLN